MWINIEDPVWDERKNELFKLENPDSFNLPNLNIGDKLYGIWYQLLIDNVIVGYFFINEMGKEYEAEIVLIEKHKRNKYGSSALKLIENIVRKKGGDKIIGIVKKTNPKKEAVITFLLKNGFVSASPISASYSDNAKKILINLSNKIDVNFIKILEWNS